MKSLDEISRLSAEDLERIGADESVPIPEDLHARVYSTVSGRSRRMRLGGIAAAAAAVVLAGGFFLSREPSPKDTFDDPYLAYAAVEKALAMVEGKVSKSIDKVEQASVPIEKVYYWK